MKLGVLSASAACIALCQLSWGTAIAQSARPECPDPMKFETLPGGEMTAIGTICPSTDDDFRSALKMGSKPPPVVLLWSPGGNVVAAMRMGRHIRKSGINTRVIGPCESACTLVAIGGVWRSISREAFFGVHQFVIDAPLSSAAAISVAQTLSADIAEYVEQMGVQPSFHRDAARHPGQATKILTTEALVRYNVINTRVVDAFKVAPDGRSLLLP